jgi:hypothetical protein
VLMTLAQSAMDAGLFKANRPVPTYYFMVPTVRYSRSRKLAGEAGDIGSDQGKCVAHFRQMK